MIENKLKVLVVDDTIIFRKTVSDILAAMPDVEVVGTANNGKIAMIKIASLKPDLVTLDIEMPEMNGIEVLEQIQAKSLDVGVIMLSTLTHEGSEMTIKALELGAFDFIPKPQGRSMAENKKAIQDAVTPMVKAFKRRALFKKSLRARTKSGLKPNLTRQAKTSPISASQNVIQRMKRISDRNFKAELVTIGISTGGPNALAKMMPELPANINVPIVIVQHMPPLFTKSLAKSLNAKCAIEVREACDGDLLQPNVALIAPGGKQMKIVAHADGRNRKIKITDDPPENSCKPSADYLFRSVAQIFVGRSTGVIMTGMGSDGTKGLQLLKKNGSYIIAQDELSCTVFGMPKEPIGLGIVDIVAPLDRIAAEIVKTVKPFKS